ncbi:hypothetical protein H5410_029208 [Solanum commersonii]|uniref:Uncharacterized protein n=1 Tax=Solanum commersonii TaxID=4109 RepID=A0A9J5Z8C2_SOLCO|nr:hypothetical protein H5410_029208 [Solanum commersonii]
MDGSRLRSGKHYEATTRDNVDVILLGIAKHFGDISIHSAKPIYVVAISGYTWKCLNLCILSPPSTCRPAVGAFGPKGTCRWLSRRNGSIAVTALKYNFHRATGRILCRLLKYTTEYCKWQSGLAAMIH